MFFNAFKIVLGAWICCFFFAGQSYAEQGVTNSEYTLFTAAKRALDSGNYAAAVTPLAKYFEGKGTKHIYGYQLYGVILLNTKQFSKAAQILERGVKEHPKNSNLYQNLGMTYYNLGKMLPAAQAFEKAYVLSQKKNHTLAYTAGQFYVQAKRYKNAIAMLQPIVGIPQAKAMWFQLLGQAYYFNKQVSKAIGTIESGLSRFSMDPSLWRMLGYFYYQGKQREKAAAAYEVAYKIKAPSQSEATQLAALYFSLYAPYSGKRLAALKNTPVATLDYVSTLFMQVGDFAAAIQAATLAVKKEYSDLRQLRLGQILLRQKSYEEAASVFRALAQKGGEYSERAQWLLAEISWDGEDWKGLATELQTLADMNGSFSGQAVQLLDVVEQLARKELKSFTKNEETSSAN